MLRVLRPTSTCVAKKKNVLNLSVNVFTTKVLIGDAILTSPTGDRHSTKV